MNPLSAVYGAISGTRNALYDHEILHSRRLTRPVVSVGNITAGGSGKTPFVIMLTNLLAARGISADILSRGYRRSSTGTQVIDGNSDVKVSGDEPLLIARNTSAPVIVSANRYDAGIVAEQRFSTDLHLLDDGFQHRQLARDIDIVLLSERDLVDTLLPVGRLREPLSSLRRADIIAVAEDFSASVSPHFSGHLWRVRRSLDLPELPVKRLFAFAGIAKPAQFFEMLRSTAVRANCEVVGERAFRDHHFYSREDIASLAATAQKLGADALITTEKDLVKIAAAGAAPELPIVGAKLKTVLLDSDNCIDRLLEILNGRRPGWRSRS